MPSGYECPRQCTHTPSHKEADHTLPVIRLRWRVWPIGTFKSGLSIVRGGIVTVLNPRVHAGLPDLICGTQRARRLNSGELLGTERADALIVARDVPNRIVESGHKALPDMTPLLEDETSCEQSCTAPKLDATFVGLALL